MSTKKKASRILLVLIVAAGLFVAIRHAATQDVGLISRAHRIGELQGTAIGFTPAPEWVSEHEAILLAYQSDGNRFEFNRLNADTGTQSDMPELNRLYSRQLLSRDYTHPNGFGTVHEPPGFVLSPGFDRVILAPVNPMGGFKTPKDTRFHVSDLAGKSDITWPKTKDETFAFTPTWLADNSRWVIPKWAGPGNWVTIHDVNDPHLTGRSGAQDSPTTLTPPLFATRDNKLCVLSDPMSTSTVSATEWDLLGKTPARTYQIDLPVTGIVYGACHSQETNRIAWVIVYNYTSEVSTMIHSLFGSYNVRSTPMYSVWVCNLDGSRFKEVGREDASRWKNRDGYIRWLPGGKKLAFHLDRDLYTISVDP